MALIQAKKLYKTYGTDSTPVHALQPCSFSIGPAEKIAIVGASGSGKSTLLHLLGGLDQPSGGTVYYEDTDIYGMDDEQLSAFRRRNLGFVFQSYNLVPELTARENILLPVWMDRKQEDKEYFRKIVLALNLTDRLEHLPGELSGGQQQRVAIARSLICKPSLILCDEPTGNLDSTNSKEVMELLLEVSSEFGAALLVVTHDHTISERMERTLTISDGVIGGDVA